MLIKLIIYLILTVSGLVLFKLSGNNTYMNVMLNKIEINLSTVTLMGIVSYGCSFLLWLNIIKDNELSYIFPMANGLVTILTVIVGIAILKENVTGIQWLGIACIIIGVFLTNLRR